MGRVTLMVTCKMKERIKELTLDSAKAQGITVRSEELELKDRVGIT